MLALARAASRRARNLTPSSSRADDADDADDAPGDADDGTRSSDSALETNAIVSPAVARAMESTRLASIDPERAVMSSSTPIADAEDAEETLEAKGLVRTGSALRAVSAGEVKRLNRMLSTDLREMMAAEVRGSRGSTLMRLTVRCPVVMMVISFSIWAGLGALALVAHPPKVETSLEGFQIRDHPTSTLLDGIDRGEKESKALWDAAFESASSSGGVVSVAVGTTEATPRAATSSARTSSDESVRRRRLVAQTSRPYRISDMQLVYTSDVEGENVLRPEVILWARDLEARLTSLPGYAEDMCLQVPGNLGPDGCSPINSIVPYFFGESASGVYMRTMLDASRILSSRGLYQYLDKEFVPERAYSKSFRTNIAIGERKKEWKAWMRNVLMPFLEQNTANATLQVRALYGGTDLYDYQSNKYMMHDVRLIAAGMSTVVMYLYLHTGSVFISLAGILEIIISFPAAYAFYAFVLKLETISVLQFLAVFIILGIGVDDVFVFYDAFEDASRAVGVRGDTLLSRLNYAFDHAGRAMLVTSMTSGAAFAANLASAIPAVQVFGVFIAVMVLINYFLVITWFPACVAAHEKYWRARRDFTCCGMGKPNVDDLKPSELERRAEERVESWFAYFKRVFIYRRTFAEEKEARRAQGFKTRRVKFSWRSYGVFLNIFKYVLVVVVLGVIAVTGYFSLQTKTSGEPPQLFPKDSNLQRFVDWTESQFDTVKFSCFTTSECETESTYVLISNGIPVLPPPPPPPPSPPPRVQDGSITTTQIDELVDVVFVQYDADSNGWP